MNYKILSRLLFASVVFSLTAFSQVTFHVSASAVGPGSGTAQNPFVLIQDAINAASSGDRVLVRPGIYTETISFLGRDLELIATGGPSVTTIDGNMAFNTVAFTNGESLAALIRGFRISGGSGIDGGGILVVNSSPRIENCVITQNTAINDGGGIHVFNGSPQLKTCVVSANSSGIRGGGISIVAGSLVDAVDLQLQGNSCLVGDGGGLAMTPGTTLTLRGGAFIANMALAGGGLWTDGATVTIDQVNFENNTSVADGGGALLANSNVQMRSATVRANASNSFGGGIWISGGAVQIHETLFAQNFASATGGGVVAFFTQLDLNNSVFAENQALAFGAGVYSSSATTTILNCTFRGNTAGSGGAVQEGGTPAVVVRNSILWGNTPDQVGVPFSGPSSIVTNSIVQGGFAGSGNTSLDPLHADPANFDYRLSAGSPAINSGSNTFAMTLSSDFFGQPRLNGSTVDRGAHEFSVPLNGSGEDLVMVATVDNRGAEVTRHVAPAGSTVRVELASPGGLFSGLPILVAGDFFPVASPPPTSGMFPSLHLSLIATQVLFDGTSAGFFGPISWSTSPFVLTSPVAPGLTGLAARIQGLAITPFAANGFFAITDAHDFIF